MDIRNITEQPAKILNGKYLEEIFELQKNLLEGYIGHIEKDLPKYPIDIHSFKGQQVLKDFSARVVEEIAEGYESTSYALALVDKYGFNLSALSDKEFDMLLNHLQNSNEEQADAMAFYVSLLLYANVSIQDIYDYTDTKLNWVCSDLEDLMNLGLEMHCRSGYVVEERNLFPLLTNEAIEDAGKDVEHIRSYIPAFTQACAESHSLEDHMVWSVTYHLNVGRNFLKNKPWKQSQELTDVTRYDEQIVLGFIKYVGYLAAMGFTPRSLYVLYFKKHKVNKFRQTSGY